MAISTQTQNLNLMPGKAAPVVVHMSQGNVGNTVRFYLYDGDQPFYPDDMTIAVHGIRADGTAFGPYAVSTTEGSNLVFFSVVSAMTRVNGAAVGELVITDRIQNQVGTANFGMLIEEAPYASGVTYEDDLSMYQRILAYVQSIPTMMHGDLLELKGALASEVSTRQTADANLQAQIDQYITPSTEQPTEVVNARVGADGTTYGTLKSRLDTEYTDLKASSRTESNATVDVAAAATTLPNTDRWFMQGVAYGLITSVQLYFRQAGSAKIEVWERLSSGELQRIYTKTETVATNYTTQVVTLGVTSKLPMYVSVTPTANNVISYNTSSVYSTMHTTDTASSTLNFVNLVLFPSMGVTGHINYITSATDEIGSEVDTIGDACKVRAHMTTQVATTAVTYPQSSTRWFMQGTAVGVITSVTLYFRQPGSVIIEVWAKIGSVLQRISLLRYSCEKEYTIETIPLRVPSDYPMYVSIIPVTGNSIGYNRDSAYTTIYTNSSSTQIDMSSVLTFPSMGVSGYISYSADESSGNASGKVKRYSASGMFYYNTIAAAVEEALDGDTIIVSPGVYTEPIEAWNKTLSIVGEDKNTCIIKNSTGNYTTPAVEIDSGRLANFTIISDAASPTLDSSSEYYMKDYCIHIDNHYATGKELIVEDCILKNNHRTAFGIGLYPNNTVTIRNCDIWCAAPPSDLPNVNYNRRGAFYFHNRQPSEYWSNCPNQRLRVIDCTVYCEDIIALYMGDATYGTDLDEHGWINDCEVEFINNMFCAKDGEGNYKKTCDGWSMAPDFENDSIISGSGAGFNDHFRLSTLSYGNNLDALNDE